MSSVGKRCNPVTSPYCRGIHSVHNSKAELSLLVGLPADFANLENGVIGEFFPANSCYRPVTYVPFLSAPNSVECFDSPRFPIRSALDSRPMLAARP